ncbi:MAG: hypothetical protein HP477_17310 [Nitrospira sp.]|nr:hypothetical protein [Nitrospira sp.]
MTGLHRVSLGLGLFGMAWLAGCSTPATVGEYPNQQRIAGRSKAAILACAGVPKKESEESGLTLLRYYREAPILEESQPVGKGSISTIRHGCWATVILKNDHAVGVHYRFVPPTFNASNDCEEMFESCGP